MDLESLRFMIELVRVLRDLFLGSSLREAKFLV